MIVLATNNHGDEELLVVNAGEVIQDMYDLYRASINVVDHRLRSGYWRHQRTNEALRLATPEEIDRVEAFRVMQKVAEEIE